MLTWLLQAILKKCLKQLLRRIHIDLSLGVEVLFETVLNDFEFNLKRCRMDFQPVVELVLESILNGRCIELLN